MATCAQCGKPFEKTRDRSTFCGVVCANRAMGKARRLAQPSANTLRVRQVRERLGARTRYHGDPITCAWCGQEFTPERSARLYCSTGCSNRATAKKRRGGRPRRIRVRYYFRLCRVCGALTEARSGPRFYCSEDCIKQYNHDQHVASYVPEPPRRYVCQVCGESFEAQGRGNGGRKYCSAECHHASPAFKSQRRRQRRLRRARMQVVLVVPYHDEDIFERDGWRCHICHRKVRRDKAGAGYHPLQPTIDHIIPLADGGADAPVNVATAHNICNSVKGASGPGQLRLLA